MPNKIYTLEALAKLEGTTAGYLRLVLARLKEKNKPMEWREYRLVQPGKNAWFAIPKDADVEFVTNGDEE